MTAPLEGRAPRRRPCPPPAAPSRPGSSGRRRSRRWPGRAPARSRWSARACTPASRTASRPIPPRWAFGWWPPACPRASRGRCPGPGSSRPPRTRLRSCSEMGVRRRSWFSISRTFSFWRSTSRASSSKPGASTSSTKIALSASASGRSTGRLKQKTPPKALWGSVARAFSKASKTSRPTAAPQRVVVLDDGRCGQLELIDQGAAGVEVEQVVEGELPPVELSHHGEQIGARPGLGVVGRPLVRVLPVGQVEHLLVRLRLAERESSPRGRRTRWRSPRRSGPCRRRPRGRGSHGCSPESRPPLLRSSSSTAS